MANSTTNLDLIQTNQAQKEITANALFDASSPSTFYGRRSSTTSLLTWGYYGGNVLIAGIIISVANDILTLTDNSTNYIEMSNATGLISVNTVGFTTDYTALYTVVTSGGNVLSYIDKRTFLAINTGTGGGSGGSGVSPNSIIQTKYPVVAPNKIVNKYNGELKNIKTTTTTTGQRFSVIEATGRFIYVINSNTVSIDEYSIDQSTGVLTNIGSISIGSGVSYGNIESDPTGRFVYATDDTSDKIFHYTINQSTGVLTSTSNIATQTGAKGVVCDPTGKYLYSTNNTSNTVSMYSINQSTGVLTNIGDIATDSSPNFITCDPTGRFVYCQNTSTINQFLINQNTGILSDITSPISSTSGNQIKVDPTGRFVYVSAGSNINQYLINLTNGSLSSLGTVSSSTSTLTIDPLGNFLYANGSSNITQYSIDKISGLLTEIFSPISNNSNIRSINIDPTGRFVYVFGNYISNIYSVNNFMASAGGFSGPFEANSGATIAGNLLNLPQFTTSNAPAYVKGGCYFDTTLNKLVIGGATAWETVTSL